MLADQLPGAQYPDIPPAINSLGNERSGKVDPPEGYLPKAKYLECLGQLRAVTMAAVDKLTDADFDKPTTNTMAKFAPTLGALFDPDRQSHAHARRPIHGGAAGARTSPW